MAQNHHRQAMEEEAERFNNSSERTVYLHMMWWADRKGVIRRSQRDIAEDTLLHRITVAKSLQALTSRGLLRKIRQGRYAIPGSSHSDSDHAEPPELLASILKLSRDGGKTVAIDPEDDVYREKQDIMQSAVERGDATAAGYTSDGSLQWRITES